jgi:small conductance mechanosensitive channel
MSERTKLHIVESGLLPAWVEPYLPSILNLFFGIMIMMVGWGISKWVHRALLGVLRRAHVEEALARFLSTLAQYGVLAATVISALNRVGVQTTSLVALLASAGLAIGLALQGSLSSFASGVMILFFRPFTLGDVVNISGHSGVVDDIGLFQTRLAAFEGETVILPNNSITSNPIVNYSARGVRRATIEVGVAYGSDVEQVLTRLKNAVARVPTGLQEPAPYLSFNALGDSSLDFVVGLWCRASDFSTTQTALRREVYREMQAAGIEIPFPQLVLHRAGEDNQDTAAA